MTSLLYSLRKILYIRRSHVNDYIISENNFNCGSKKYKSKTVREINSADGELTRSSSFGIEWFIVYTLNSLNTATVTADRIVSLIGRRCRCIESHDYCRATFRPAKNYIITGVHVYISIKIMYIIVKCTPYVQLDLFSLSVCFHPLFRMRTTNKQ